MPHRWGVYHGVWTIKPAVAFPPRLTNNVLLCYGAALPFDTQRSRFFLLWLYNQWWQWGAWRLKGVIFNAAIIIIIIITNNNNNDNNNHPCLVSKEWSL